MVNEVRIWGKMRLTKTAGQARLTHAEAHAFDDDPSELLDWKLADAYYTSN